MREPNGRLRSFTAPTSVLEEMERDGEEYGEDVVDAHMKRVCTVAEGDDEYTRRWHSRKISPERYDAFAAGEVTPDPHMRTFKDVMQQHLLARERHVVDQPIHKAIDRKSRNKRVLESGEEVADVKRGKKEHESSRPQLEARSEISAATTAVGFVGMIGTDTPRSRWDKPPQPLAGTVSQTWEWDATPTRAESVFAAKDDVGKSRWDETPVNPMADSTPIGGMSMETPSQEVLRAAVPRAKLKFQPDVEERNLPWEEEELDQVLPQEGFALVSPPPGYVVATPSQRLLSSPTPGCSPAFAMPSNRKSDPKSLSLDGAKGLLFSKPEDVQLFGELLADKEEEEMSAEKRCNRHVMRLVLRVKNGCPPVRKQALRQLITKASTFGARLLFNQLLPALLSPSLEEQERHMLLKTVDLVLFQLGDAARPHVHASLAVIQPLLIDDDHYARTEGREVLAKLSKAIGLAAMLSATRTGIDDACDWMRDVTARTLERGCLPWDSGASSLLHSRDAQQEELAGAPHRRQDAAAARTPHRQRDPSLSSPHHRRPCTVTR